MVMMFGDGDAAMVAVTSEEQPSGDGAWLRRLNTSRVLQALYPHAIKSITQIGQDLSLSRPTVAGAIKTLLDERGLVAKLPPQHQDTGRPPAMYRFRRAAGYLLGVEVAPGVIRVLLTDLAGEITPEPANDAAQIVPCQHERVISENAGRAERLHELEDAIGTALRSAGITHEQVWAVVAGTPGIVDPDGKILVCGRPMQDWTGDHLITCLRRLFSEPDCHVQVENNANLAAVAEHRGRGDSRPANLVYLLAGHALGIGIIAADALHRGRGGRAGEIANQRSSPFAAASELLYKHKDENPTAIFRAAERGDIESERAIATFVEHLALGLATLVYTIDPDLIVIGGSLAGAGAGVVDPTREHLDQLCRGREVSVEASTLGDQVVPRGALHLALDHAHHRMFTTHAQ